MEVRNTSRILTTPEQIVRDHRNRFKGRPSALRFEAKSFSSSAAGPDGPLARREAALQPQAKRSSDWLGWAVRFFLIFVFGWLFGYLHHFLTTPR